MHTCPRCDEAEYNLRALNLYNLYLYLFSILGIWPRQLLWLGAKVSLAIQNRCRT